MTPFRFCGIDQNPIDQLVNDLRCELKDMLLKVQYIRIDSRGQSIQDILSQIFKGPKGHLELILLP